MRKAFILLVLLLAFVSSGYGQGTGPITVKEADGSPSRTGIRTFIFDNGTVTISGNTARISGGGGAGTVTSVAQSFTGGLISVGGSPVTTSGTLALTVAGTSGGIPYFSSSSTWASSAALAANAVVIGGGAGTAPATTTTATGIVTFIGTPSSANFLAALTNETGTGLVMGNDTPTIITPSFTTGFTIGGAATSRKMIVGNGTNFVASTETWAVPGTSGNVLTSDGTNWTSAAAAGSALTSTFVGYGNGSNVLTGTSDFAYATASKTATITSASTAFLDLTGVSTASALRVASGTHPGSGGGVIFPFTGGDQTSGPGVWWCNGAYNACSRFNLNLGFVFQGGSTSTSPVKILKGTGTSSDGGLIFELRPDDGTFNTYPFGASAGNTTEHRFLELAANGTNYTALKAADTITTNSTIVLPINPAPSVGDVLAVSAVSGGVVSSAWTAASSVVWNNVGSATGNAAFANTTFNTAVTQTTGVWSLIWSGNTSTSSLFLIQDNNTSGSGYIADFQATSSSSNLKPFRLIAKNSTLVDTTAAGLMTITPAVTGGIGTGDGLTVSVASSAITSGNLLKLTSTATTGLTGMNGLNIAISGANGSTAQTITGATIAVTNTNATSGTNIGLTLTASGATTANTALNVTAGRVLIDTTNSTSVPPLAFSTDTTTGINHPATSQMGVVVNSFQALQILGNGSSSTILRLSGGTLQELQWGSSGDAEIRRVAANSLAIGAPDAASPSAQSLSVSSVVAGTADTAGASWTFKGSQGTGTGLGGSIILQTAPAAASTASTQNALVTALTIDSKAHLIHGGTAPTVGGSCGTSPSLAGTDQAGKVTAGTVAPTSCTVTFNKTWTNAPACIGVNETTSNLLKAISTTTTVILSGTMVASDVLAYICSGY